MVAERSERAVYPSTGSYKTRSKLETARLGANLKQGA
jgi:hypothetical protein